MTPRPLYEGEKLLGYFGRAAAGDWFADRRYRTRAGLLANHWRRGFASAAAAKDWLRGEDDGAHNLFSNSKGKQA